MNEIEKSQILLVFIAHSKSQMKWYMNKDYFLNPSFPYFANLMKISHFSGYLLSNAVSVPFAITCMKQLHCGLNQENKDPMQAYWEDLSQPCLASFKSTEPGTATCVPRRFMGRKAHGLCAFSCRAQSICSTGLYELLFFNKFSHFSINNVSVAWINWLCCITEGESTKTHTRSLGMSCHFI